MHAFVHRYWLSASAFFNQFFRVYSPIVFGQKYDKNGNFIRHYVPALQNMPAKYIYEPWTAPLSVQQQVNRNSSEGCRLCRL